MIARYVIATTSYSTDVKVSGTTAFTVKKEYLKIDDIRSSSFFEKESKESFDKVAENLIKNQLPPDLPPLPVLKEPVAEMQPTYGQAA